MFYYYGRKEKVFKYYPSPKNDTIIEPFAGSAVYSLKNFEKNIIILDKDERIINIWNYLKEVSLTETIEILSAENVFVINRAGKTCFALELEF